MPDAGEDTQELAPRSHGFAVLVGHNPRNLVQMRQIMRGPRGEQLSEIDRAERRMVPASFEILSPQI